MGNTTLGAITLQDLSSSFIIENTCRKESLLTPMPLYLMDSSSTDVFDFGGVVKTITLTGIYVGGSVAGCKTWIDSVEGTIQGHQDTDAGYPLTFTDDLRGTVKVKVMDFESTMVEADPQKCTWTLKLIQASTNA